MPVDLERTLRPVDSPMEPYPPKFVTLASGEAMVIRQIGRDDVPSLLEHVEPLVHVERDYYDIVAARVYELECPEADRPGAQGVRGRRRSTNLAVDGSGGDRREEQRRQREKRETGSNPGGTHWKISCLARGPHSSRCPRRNPRK